MDNSVDEFLKKPLKVPATALIHSWSFFVHKNKSTKKQPVAAN
ncbi:hypothetical protein C4K11_0349 [Pseudomonas chlororaphis subsp. aureofaciens]|nr:hypothetical protein C4K11_0349 [Pseudomonas chlororaphis subsp. aureofaciens]